MLSSPFTYIGCEMLKRIPKKTKLLGYTIHIEEISQAAMDEMCDTKGNDGLWAQSYMEGRFKIYLCKESSVENKWYTLWHEMGHAWLDISAADIETRCQKDG